MTTRLVGCLVAALLAAFVAGCGKDQPDAVSRTPQPATSFPFSVPPVTHHWNPDVSACLTLTGSAGGLTGPGTLVRGSHSKNQSLLYCHWGPDDETAPAAELQLSTSKRQEASDAAWKILGAPERDNTPLPNVGEQAFVGPDTGKQFHVIVRSGNATLDITLKGAKNDAAALTSLHDAAPDIANGMVSCLVPA
jgi:hypothetical protein